MDYHFVRNSDPNSMLVPSRSLGTELAAIKLVHNIQQMNRLSANQKAAEFGGVRSLAGILDSKSRAYFPSLPSEVTSLRGLQLSDNHC